MTIVAITENWEKVSTFQFFLDFKPRFARGLHNTVFNINPFHATVLFLYPLKTSGNLWFSDVFSGDRKRQVGMK